MLYREIIAVCSEIHTKHINTLCGQNVEFVNVTPGGTYSNRWVLRLRNAEGNAEGLTVVPVILGWLLYTVLLVTRLYDGLYRSVTVTMQRTVPHGGSIWISKCDDTTLTVYNRPVCSCSSANNIVHITWQYYHAVSLYQLDKPYPSVPLFAAIKTKLKKIVRAVAMLFL
jgi:hypothetical protein